MKVSPLVPTALVLALVGATACAEDDVEMIKAIRMKSNEAIARHDVDDLTSYLDKDFVITISTGAIERSREEHGTWVGSRTRENGKFEFGGQYTAAWKKTDDVWRIYSELFVGLYCNGVDC